MPHSRKVVLHLLNGMPPNIEELAQQLVDDRVAFVAAVGRDCEKVEEWIDEVAAFNGSLGKHFILTSSHPGQSLQDAIEFAMSLSDEYAGEVQVVEVP